MAKVSYGIALFERNPITEGLLNNRVLLGVRSTSYEYADFVRGRYKDTTRAKQLIKEMNKSETKFVRDNYNDFGSLWNKQYGTRKYCKGSHSRMLRLIGDIGKGNFETFLTEAHENAGERTELECPKGRRGKNEGDLDCAKREVKEEVGIGSESYNVINDFVVSVYNDGFTVLLFVGYLKDGVTAEPKADRREFNDVLWKEIGDIGIDDGRLAYKTKIALLASKQFSNIVLPFISDDNKT